LVLRDKIYKRAFCVLVPLVVYCMYIWL